MNDTENIGFKKDGVLIPKIIQVIREHYGVFDEKDEVVLEHSVGAIFTLASVIAAYVTLMCGGDTKAADESVDSICSAMKKTINRGGENK